MKRILSILIIQIIIFTNVNLQDAFGLAISPGIRGVSKNDGKFVNLETLAQNKNNEELTIVETFQDKLYSENKGIGGQVGSNLIENIKLSLYWGGVILIVAIVLGALIGLNYFLPLYLYNAELLPLWAIYLICMIFGGAAGGFDHAYVLMSNRFDHDNFALYSKLDKETGFKCETKEFIPEDSESYLKDVKKIYDFKGKDIKLELKTKELKLNEPNYGLFTDIKVGNLDTEYDLADLKYETTKNNIVAEITITKQLKDFAETFMSDIKFIINDEYTGDKDKEVDFLTLLIAVELQEADKKQHENSLRLKAAYLPIMIFAEIMGSKKGKEDFVLRYNENINNKDECEKLIKKKMEELKTKYEDSALNFNDISLIFPDDNTFNDLCGNIAKAA